MLFTYQIRVHLSYWSRWSDRKETCKRLVLHQDWASLISCSFCNASFIFVSLWRSSSVNSNGRLTSLYFGCLGLAILFPKFALSSAVSTSPLGLMLVVLDVASDVGGSVLTTFLTVVRAIWRSNCNLWKEWPDLLLDSLRETTCCPWALPDGLLMIDVNGDYKDSCNMSIESNQNDHEVHNRNL